MSCTNVQAIRKQAQLYQKDFAGRAAVVQMDKRDISAIDPCPRLPERRRKASDEGAELYKKK